MIHIWLSIANVIYICDKGDTVDVVVPPLAESISDGTLAQFLKSMLSCIFFCCFLFELLIYELLVTDCRVLICYMGAGPGDRVNADEPIAQIETDKVLCRSNMPIFVKDTLGFLLVRWV